MTKVLPDFSFEQKIWKRGYKFIGGIDEVGRGALAGPVVAAAVVFVEQKTESFWFKAQQEKITIKDSKKMSSKQREIANKWIKENALTWGIGSSSVSEINKFGIVKATQIAFRKAIKSCNKRIDFLMIDAFYIPYVIGLKRKKQLAIIKGDTKSISIAAASIIAKVYRDNLMTKLSNNPKYKKYKWGENKGYGTKVHQNAIKTYGKTRLHRVSFLFKFS